MKSLAVIQHDSAEYLGLIEDHLEGRRIRFQYFRPFTEGGKLPASQDMKDGLVILGGGPWGTAGARDVPTLKEEIEITRACYMAGRPIIAIGLGAQILALAADGGSKAAPLTFRAGYAMRTVDDALNGYLPERFPHVVYMRDKPVVPNFAKILAVDEDDEPAIFQIGANIFGFTGHPGMKLAIAEDLIMEFEEGPENPGETLKTLGAMKKEIEDSLVGVMTGLVQLTGLMSTN